MGLGSEDSLWVSFASVNTEGAEWDRRVSLLFLFRLAMRFAKEDEFGVVIMGMTASEVIKSRKPEGKSLFIDGVRGVLMGSSEIVSLERRCSSMVILHDPK